MSPVPARGEVWWCELSEIGRRPVVVLSRNAAIPRLRRALVAPCTTTIRGLPSEVILDPGEDPIPRRSAVNLDSVEGIAIAVLGGAHRAGFGAGRELALPLPVGAHVAFAHTRQPA